ncbi:MAG: response regulator transcription factor [Lachnospiraceae bacterium]|nr:response regulator transcription factor [Lachnospiraceae bacterium]
MMTILIVEDDKPLNDGIALSLNEAKSLQAYNLKEARALLNETVDLIILDINLPDGSGLDFCREIRTFSSQPIIFLTANDMELDIVAGLSSGADDYITKPFSLAVLRARIDAVMRRHLPAADVYEQGGFFFDFGNMIFKAGETTVNLSKTEQKLLKLLVSNKGITLSRDNLIDRIWSDGAEFVEENALSVTIGRLRQKLNGAPIRTVYGIGYVWEA